MRPRKWSDKSRPGALRIPASKPPKKDGIIRVDPFSECSAAFYKFKVAQGQEFRRRKRDSDRWKRHQLAFEKGRTQVNACKVTVHFLRLPDLGFAYIYNRSQDPMVGELGRVKVLHKVFLRPKFWRIIFKRFKCDDSDKEWFMFRLNSENFVN